MPKLKPPKTTDEVKAEFRLRGESQRDWARARGYSDRLVYALLCGRNKGHRGVSHNIAVELGLKHGVLSTTPTRNPKES